MDKIREQLRIILGLDASPDGDDLSGFSAKQLEAAEKKARKMFEVARKDRDKESAELAVEVVETVKAELTRRETEDAEAAAKFEELAGRISASDEPEGDPAGEGDEPKPEEEPEPETPAGDEPKPEVTPVAEVTPEAVAAAAATPTNPVPPPSKPGSTTADEPKLVITAAGDVQGYSAGQFMEANDIGKAFVAKSDALIASGAKGRATVATISWKDQYDESRSLSDRDSIDRNDEKIQAAVEEAQANTAEVLRKIVAAGRKGDKDEIRALAAAGGLCAPVGVRYEIYQVGSTARPIRDGLVRFAATRGGIRFNSPPQLTDVASGVNVYLESDDASGSRYPKGCVAVTCGDDNEVHVSAIPLCMTVGNYSKLFFPEQFQASWQLGQVQHARVAETTLWDRMTTLSTAVTSAQHFGATRDILAHVTQAAIQYRNRHRIDKDTPLRLFLPDWAEDLMLTDLSRQMPGDDALDTTDADLIRYFAIRNIAVTYTLDGQEMSATQRAGGLNPWATSVQAILHAEGTFLFLDGGTLDFGTDIRDFTQIKNNESGAFMETFEEVAFVGNESVSLTIDTCPSGIAQALANVDVCTSGS